MIIGTTCYGKNNSRKSNNILKIYKTNVKKMETQPMGEWEKNSNHVADKEFVSIVYKEDLQLNNKKDK